MPRRSSFRRRYFRRRGRSSYGRYKRTRMGLGRIVRTIASSIPEKKYFECICAVSDAVGYTTPGSAAWASVHGDEMLSADFLNQITLLGAIQQGVAVNQRIGNRIHVKYVQIALIFQFNNNIGAQNFASNPSNMYGMFCRYVLLLDNQPNGNALPLANIWTDWGPTIGGGAHPSAVGFNGARTFAFRNVNALRQFRVLLDMQHTSHNQANGTAGASSANPAPTSGIQVVQHYVPINRTVTYNAVASAGDLLTSHAVMKDHDIILNVIPSDIGCCQCYCSFRVCYTDA